MRGPFNLACVVCTDNFESPNPNARYCSDRCRRRARKRAPGEYARRRRADKVKRLRPLILERFGRRCYLCSREITIGPEDTRHPLALTLDHVMPITAGGPDTLENLRPAHRHCNEDKGERLPSWWERQLAGVA